jgi:O-antigen/teichoic acid export membrane protein
MVRRFFKDSAIYAVAGVLSQGISFLLFPFLAHHFTPNDYGVIDIVGLVSTILYLSVALEINQGLGRYFTETNDERERVALASTALIFTVGAYLVMAAVTLPLAGPITRAVFNPSVNPWVVRVAIAGVVVAGILYVAQDQLRWRMRQRAFAVVSITLAFVTTAVTALLVLALHVGVIGAIVGQLAGSTAALVVVLGLSWRAYAPVFDRSKCRAMLSFSLPLVPASVGVFLNNFADRWAVLQTRTLSDVGVYGVGFRIASAMSLLLLGFQGAATPLIFSRYREASTPAEIARIFRIFTALTLSLFVVLSLFADALVHALASSSYHHADVVVPYLTLGSLLFGAYIFAPGLWLAKRTRMAALISVFAGLLNLGLALALTPPLGIRGAGIATAASSGAFFVLTMMLSQRHYSVPHNWLRLGAAFILSLAVVAGGRSLLPIGDGHAFELTALLAKAVVAVVTMAILVALLISPRELSLIASVLRRRTSAASGPSDA